MKALLSHPELTRIIRFLIVGFVNTAFGYGVYALAILVGIAPHPALILSFVIGVLWNYQTHARLVFAAKGARRLPAYAGVYLGLYAVNAGMLEGLLRLGLPPLIAQALYLPVSAVLAYLAVGKVLTGRFPWQVTPPAPSPEDPA